MICRDPRGQSGCSESQPAYLASHCLIGNRLHYLMSDRRVKHRSRVNCLVSPCRALPCRLCPAKPGVRPLRSTNSIARHKSLREPLQVRPFDVSHCRSPQFCFEQEITSAVRSVCRDSTHCWNQRELCYRKVFNHVRVFNYIRAIP
jgi:hypothetical protein